MQIRVYIAVSLDGFIARLDGSIDWLVNHPVPEGQDFGFAEFFESVDALVMGSGTFEMARSFGMWPYGKKPVVVMSHRTLDLSGLEQYPVELVDLSPASLLALLDSRGLHEIYVDGGKVIQSFLREGLIDELTITRLPLLIGTGLPLFGEVPADIVLTHARTQTFENGFVQSTYVVKR